MWKLASIATVLLIAVGAGGYALTHRSLVKSVASSGQTTAPGVDGRKWMQEHGYAVGERPIRRGRHRAGQP